MVVPSLEIERTTIPAYSHLIDASAYLAKLKLTEIESVTPVFVST